MGDVEKPKNDRSGLVVATTIGAELGKWFGTATALEVVAATRAGAKMDDRSVLLSFLPGFNRNVAIPTYGLTSTVLYGTSAILKAAYKL